MSGFTGADASKEADTSVIYFGQRTDSDFSQTLTVNIVPTPALEIRTNSPELTPDNTKVTVLSAARGQIRLEIKAEAFRLTDRQYLIQLVEAGGNRLVAELFIETINVSPGYRSLPAGATVFDRRWWPELEGR